MIPKIIHHIAPKDKGKWHPLWKPCYDSWLDKFKGFEFKLWNDKEDIDDLVMSHYPEFWNLYKSFPYHIMRIDFARFCFLHLYGGIYADMDVYCYHNFHNYLNGGVYLLEAPWGDVPIENALMVSDKGNEFFRLCMEKSQQSYGKVKDKLGVNFIDPINRKVILNTAGPGIPHQVALEYKGKLGILSGELYNNHGMAYHPKLITRHVLTGMWGEEAFDNLKLEFKQMKRGKKHSFRDFMKEVYINEVKKYAYMDNVTFENFDFYKDYTNGEYLKKQFLT